MNSIWFSLAWKEWHEHKWKLAASVATLCALAAFMLFQGPVRDVFQATMSLTLIAITPFAIFVGLVAASGERARRTLPFVQSLPIPLWQVATVKIAIGLLTLVSAIIVATVFIYVGLEAVNHLWATQATVAANPAVITGSWLLDAILFCSSAIATLFIWVAATGVNRKDEISAAAVSLVVITVWLCAIGCGSYLLYGQQALPRWFEATLLSATPLWFIAFVPGSPAAQYWASNLAIVFAINGSLLAWYVSRFGRVTGGEIRSPRLAEMSTHKLEWLPSPQRSRTAAIVWKQIRESVPIAAVGFFGTVLVAGIMMFTSYITLEDAKAFGGAGDTFARVGVVMGVFVALVLGIGVCHSDMSPGINTFWRTRPINPDSWFALKFITGLAVLLASIYLPNGILAMIDAAPISSGMMTNPWLLPLIQVATFAAALAIYCLVRQPIYAAILTIPLVYTGLFVVWVTLWTSGQMDSPNSWNALHQMTDIQAVIGFSLSFLFSTTLAWLAMRFDWGWKGRY